MTQTLGSTVVNGIDTQALRDAISAIAADPAKAMTRWQVSTRWKGGTRSDTSVKHFHIGGQRVDKDFTIRIDEPCELCGTNQYANPQEYLLAALNACMTVGYASACALHGIELEELRIETEGDIDLRGFLGIDPSVKPGYDSLKYTVHIKGNGTAEQFQKVHETVSRLSPNRFNIASAIRLNGTLVVE
ncbi:OsmC family protein [Fontivita pretiosa]|uniref:OsmC family protein n=1 Tax=Fontivita pretiosa TaxID=2989684 RepID=UPI003D1702F7